MTANERPSGTPRMRPRCRYYDMIIHFGVVTHAEGVRTMNIAIWIAEKLGFLEKMRLRIQGVKTYLVNAVQALGGLIALLALAGQFLDLVARSLSVLTGWGDGGQTVGQGMDSIKIIWSNHAALALGFSAALYSITDALSKMSSYAAGQRRGQAVIAATQAAVCPQVESRLGETKP